jgi:hypothetical protein
MGFSRAARPMLWWWRRMTLLWSWVGWAEFDWTVWMALF